MLTTEQIETLINAKNLPYVSEDCHPLAVAHIVAAACAECDYLAGQIVRNYGMYKAGDLTREEFDEYTAGDALAVMDDQTERETDAELSERVLNGDLDASIEMDIRRELARG